MLPDSPAHDCGCQTTDCSPQDVLPFACGPIEALDFPRRCAELCSNAVGRASESQTPANTTHRALDVGCAVGGMTFELTRGFDEVWPCILGLGPRNVDDK